MEAIAYLDFLPDEVWLACWMQCSRRQLRRLSLVCQRFRSLVLPLLMKHHTFDAMAVVMWLTQDNWMERVRHLHRTAVRLDRLSEVPFASLVRSWKVVFWTGDTTRIFYTNVEVIRLLNLMNDRLVVTLSNTLTVYHNLSSLHLTNAIVDTILRESLASLPMLEDLHLLQCNVIASRGFLGLKSLTITGINDQESLQIASPQSLRTLSAGDHLPCLMRGFGSEKLHQLVDLSIATFGPLDVDEVVSNFGQFRHLESLTVYSLQHNDIHSPAPPHVMPLLSTLTGPPALHHWLAPGRPLSSAQVLHSTTTRWREDALMPLCLAIACSSVPVLSITLLPPISVELETLVAMISLFPDLKELSFVVWGTSYVVRGRLSNTDQCTQSGLPQVVPVDRRGPDLNDEAAFDELPVDDISDVEADEICTVIVTKPVPKMDGWMPINDSLCLHNTFRWIMDGMLVLPPSIETLRVENNGDCLLLSPTEQHEAIAVLCGLYPLLREVQFGRSHNWKWNGEFWKSVEEKSRVRIV
ncbi:hypothetical protein MVEN_02327500 [Mycena venus]|uniref:F-box domain-containing protein n=1 Tax=Mycena venus TaxID=2733690 RepID=A0A8H6X3W5_9AGAR|nr:hypothetical protein MVEN_02327500 [Mycena venus]